MRKLAWFACSAAAAMALAVYLPDGYVWWAAVFLLAASGLLVVRLRRRAVAVLLGLTLGFSWFIGYRAALITPAQKLVGTPKDARVTVADYPGRTRYGSSVAVKLRQDGRTYKALLYLNENEPELAPGDEIAGTMEFKTVNDRYSQDSSMYYRAIGYTFTGSIEKGYTVRRAERLPLRYVPVWMAKQLGLKISELFAEDTVPFMQALLTGDRSGFDYATKNDLSVSGISHVVAISGMHVSVLVALLATVLRRRKLTAAVAIPTLLVFMLMTGARPSVVRACVMQILLLLAPLANRESDSPTSMSAALLLILMINPWAVSDVGLQLSFAATAGVVLLAGRMNRRVMEAIKCRTPRFGKTKLAKFLSATACTTLAALLFTTPIVAVSFGLLSVLSIVTNLLTLTAVTVCFQAGLLTCLLGFALPAVAAVPAWVLGWLVRYILWVSRAIARIPFAAVYTQNTYIVVWIIFAYVLTALFLWQRPRRPAQFALCLAASLCICFGLSRLEELPVQIQTTVLDVGQGQCIVISADGAEAMIDCGGSYAEEAGETASRYQLSRGKPELDFLLLTHYDRDHAGGVPQLLDRLQVRALYLPDVQPDSELRQSIEAAAREQNTQVLYVTQDLTLNFGQTTYYIFAPVSGGNENDACLSVLCSRQSYDILVTGDMTDKAEQLLLARYTFPKVELLIAGHHGAAASTGQALLAAVQPDVVTISVGENNRYGHPAEQTLERIAETGAAVYRTDQMRTITVRR